MTRHVISWYQDLINQAIVPLNRERKTFNLPINYITTPSLPCEFGIDAPRSLSRNVDVENSLQRFSVTNPRDLITEQQQKTRDSKRLKSNRLLYRTYHQHEIHSLAYPNIDHHPWNNLTKALYRAHDYRNKRFEQLRKDNDRIFGKF
ncbi:MAG: hypothetical protein ABIN35_00045 [candidate division WOR-3 bacterium]